jgi:hypothetical protein
MALVCPPKMARQPTTQSQASHRGSWEKSWPDTASRGRRSRTQVECSGDGWHRRHGCRARHRLTAESEDSGRYASGCCCRLVANSRAPTPFRAARTLGRRTITEGRSISNKADSRNTRYFVTGLISLPSTDRTVKGPCRCLHHFQSEIPPQPPGRPASNPPTAIILPKPTISTTVVAVPDLADDETPRLQLALEKVIQCLVAQAALALCFACIFQETLSCVSTSTFARSSALGNPAVVIECSASVTY